MCDPSHPMHSFRSAAAQIAAAPFPSIINRSDTFRCPTQGFRPWRPVYLSIHNNRRGNLRQQCETNTSPWSRRAPSLRLQSRARCISAGAICAVPDDCRYLEARGRKIYLIMALQASGLVTAQSSWSDTAFPTGQVPSANQNRFHNFLPDLSSSRPTLFAGTPAGVP